MSTSQWLVSSHLFFFFFTSVGLCNQINSLINDSLIVILLLGKWLLMQSLDNQILVYSTRDRFRLNRKKRFHGHINGGYACEISMSPDGQYVKFFWIWNLLFSNNEKKWITFHWWQYLHLFRFLFRFIDMWYLVTVKDEFGSGVGRRAKCLRNSFVTLKWPSVVCGIQQRHPKLQHAVGTVQSSIGTKTLNLAIKSTLQILFIEVLLYWKWIHNEIHSHSLVTTCTLRSCYLLLFFNICVVWSVRIEWTSGCNFQFATGQELSLQSEFVEKFVFNDSLGLQGSDQLLILRVILT